MVWIFPILFLHVLTGLRGIVGSLSFFPLRLRQPRASVAGGAGHGSPDASHWHGEGLIEAEEEIPHVPAAHYLAGAELEGSLLVGRARKVSMGLGTRIELDQMGVVVC